jgi:RHS repeat-associated protein
VNTPYTYPAPGARHPHAPTRVGDDTYTWDAAGNLASRTVTGRAETFTWDVESRLQSVTGPAGTTSFVYDPSGQRLLRRTPDGRTTLYVAGHEITVNADGSPVSAVRPYTFDGQLVAIRTLAGVEYLVSDVAGSVELAAPSGGVPTATRAYTPYGRVRAQDGDIATDRGFLGQIEDASTGLSYLNARYYDTTIGVFISTDPVYDTSKVKTLNPYGYSSGNPTTFADPGGMYSMYTYSLESENSLLRRQNKQLRDYIGQLTSQIEELQGVIRRQQSDFKKLLSYVGALEAEIARQASIIRRLQADVARLHRMVAAQQREISKLRYQVGYYKGIVDKLGLRLWGGTPIYAQVMNSIHSFHGIPAGAFAHDRISELSAEVAAYRGRVSDLIVENTDLLLENIEQSGRISDLEWNLDFYENELVPGMSNQLDWYQDRVRELEFELAGGSPSNAEAICAGLTASLSDRSDPLAWLTEAAQWPTARVPVVGPLASNICFVTGTG